MIRYDRERPLGAGSGRVALGPLTAAEEKIDYMARQCWLIGQFWLVLYNQTIFIGLRKFLVIGQFSFSLFFSGHHLGSIPSFTGTN